MSDNLQVAENSVLSKCPSGLIQTPKASSRRSLGREAASNRKEHLPKGRVRVLVRKHPPSDGICRNEDPIWDAEFDWTTLQRPAEVVPVEGCFEMFDRAEWVMKLQRRRDQAMRQGKRKLVLKIERTIADAQEAERKSCPRRDGHASSERSQCQKFSVFEDPECGEIDAVWSMDWCALPTVAAM